MYIIIVGAGRVGRHLAEFLIKKKHEVTLIEKEKDVCNEISKELDVLIINGDGTQVKTLEEVNIATADAFVACTGKDEVNLLSSLIAKNSGAKMVISRVSKPEYKEVFLKLGVDVVVSPELTAAEYISKLITIPSISDLAILAKSDVEILEYVVNEDSRILNKKISEIKPKNYLIIAVYKNGKLIIPSGETQLGINDRVLVLVKSDAIREVDKLFTKSL
ncbi:MAG: TrkA family potassium uptake protein [Thermoplasmata archaeon]|nr:MAG: TrkA family potassium uptake protein [Thermoplasmata archaeon]